MKGANDRAFDINSEVIPPHFTFKFMSKNPWFIAIGIASVLKGCRNLSVG